MSRGAKLTKNADPDKHSYSAQVQVYNFVYACIITGATAFLFVNATKIYQFKAKDSEIKKISFVFRKYFKRLIQLITWKKTGLNGYVYEFSFDHVIIDTSNFIDIHKYLIKKKMI